MKTIISLALLLTACGDQIIYYPTPEPQPVTQQTPAPVEYEVVQPTRTFVPVQNYCYQAAYALPQTTPNWSVNFGFYYNGATWGSFGHYNYGYQRYVRSVPYTYCTSVGLY